MQLLAPTIILVLFICVRSGDIAITAARVNDVIRAICYGIVALLALITLVIALLVNGH
jgi:hypothetical protein